MDATAETKVVCEPTHSKAMPRPLGLFSRCKDSSSLVDTSHPNNMGGIIIANCKREEDIALQRYPLSNAIFAEL